MIFFPEEYSKANYINVCLIAWTDPFYMLVLKINAVSFD